MIESVIFDLDDTLIDMNDHLFSEIVPILNYLQDNNYKLYICSHNIYAERILKLLKIHHYFTQISCGYKDSIFKLDILEDLKLNKETTIFFDSFNDLLWPCKQNGWNIIKINTNIGVYWNDIEKLFSHSTIEYKKNKSFRTIRLPITTENNMKTNLENT